MDRVSQLSGDSRGNKRPEPKPLDNKPNIKEECRICHKLYANKTTLFRHYRAIHQEMNPEKYHGCSVNNTVVSLDTSFRSEFQCSICGYLAPNQKAFEAHNRSTHSNVVNDISSNDNGNTNKENVSNNVINIKDKMHKCEECDCYFKDRNKFDEHMKVQHGFEVVCKICNKNLLFQDVDRHVKDIHPDVYIKKRKKETVKIIVEKIMKNKKGKVHVFICTKCDIKMYEKFEAERHATSHKKIKPDTRNKVPITTENDSTENDNVILTCTDCDISTGSYDAAVEHSQNHITNTKGFVTQLCEICDLKFEPLCYKKHVDLHYKNKEIHRESFKYFKYKFELLSSEDWTKCFDMADSVVKKMISESIYAHTRIVKMRVLNEGKYKLYKCCKCDNFVEPAAVLNHAANYDTCVKVKCSYPCNICKRTFNNRLARNNHAKDHKSDEAYEIVLFNHVNDKEFNEKLTADKLKNDMSSSSTLVCKVLYKCLCGLCFVKKETADKHKTTCPGKHAKNKCPGCNNLFDRDELLVHCFEHHVNNARIVIEDITPEVIVVDSDDEVIEISDDEYEQGQNVDTIKIEAIQQTRVATNMASSREDEADMQNSITPGTAEVRVKDEETAMPDIETNKDDDNNIIHSELEDVNEMTDDDSQDTITYENTETGSNAAPNISKRGELKLVPANLLLNPFHIENGLLKVMDKGALNTEINADIENVREHIETTTDEPNEHPIKEERSWWWDPTDYSYISKRPSLRQLAAQTSSSRSIEVESFLTDDEDTGNPGDEGAADIDMREDTDNSISSNAQPITEHNEETTATTDTEMNEQSHIANNHIAENENGNTIEDSDRPGSVINKNNKETELNIENPLNSTQIQNNVEENTEQEERYSDDDSDLFVPSCHVNPKGNNIELNNNQLKISKDIRNVEQTENALNIEPDNENNDCLNADGNINHNVINDIDNVERQDNTEDREPVPRDTSTNTDNVNILVPSKLVQNIPLQEQIRELKDITEEQEFTNINIKSEIISENESENSCDGEVQIKSEPNDDEYNENKENASAASLISYVRRFWGRKK